MPCEATWSRLQAGEVPESDHLAVCSACAALVVGAVPRGVRPPAPHGVAARVRARQRRRAVAGLAGGLVALVLAAGAWRAYDPGADVSHDPLANQAPAEGVEDAAAPNTGVAVLDVLDAADASLDARADTPADDLLALLEPAGEDPLLAADDLHALVAPSTHAKAHRSP